MVSAPSSRQTLPFTGLFLLALHLGFAWQGSVCAQPPGGGVEAIAAEPYGVARLFLPAGQIASTESLRILVADDNDRILFPAIDLITSEPPQVRPPAPSGRPRIGNGAIVNRIRSAIQNAKEQIDPPELIRVQFLFRGTEPFTIRLSGDIQGSMEVKPLPVDFPATSATAKNDPTSTPAYQALLHSWWDGFVQQAKRQIERSDYPSIVENYLTHMLAYRYGFEVPELVKPQSLQKKRQTDPLPTLALVAGVEQLRAELLQETLRQNPSGPMELVPVPPAPQWMDHPVPETPANLPIESIAMQVPPECFYLRFATFSNYLWFRQLSEQRGGDLAQMAVLRGFNYDTNRRMERMLNTKTTTVAKLFGDSIIGDMAIVGQDLYLKEGPSLGVLFEAKNIDLLKSSLNQERTAAVKKLADIGCRLETITIANTPVSLLSTPDHQVRSFMVDRGAYVFLTTSHRLAQRFLEVADGQPSLGSTKAYRFARLMMPLENRYDIFAYFSSEFLRNLVSPSYQIELRRRLKAIAAIEIAEMASLTSAAETGITPSVPNIDRLIADGYLPETFQERPDGSQTLAYSNAWHDSLRGRRGSFLPIADVEVRECSPQEAQAYMQQANFYATQWQQTDPLMVGVRRFAREPGERIERLAIEAYIAPLGREKYGWLANMLAPPVRTQIELPPDDVINLQVHLAGQGIGRSYAPDHVMFAGLKDMVPPVPGETKGLLASLRTFQSLPAYIGAWPRAGYLDQLPLGLGGGIPDAMGFSKMFMGAWRWQMGGFSVVSFDRSILENCANYLQPVPARDFAQGRIKVGDLDNSKLSAWFNTFWFRRAAQTTRGNLMLLDSLQQQLRVEPDQALIAAERLLDAKLQCSLGGQYVLEQPKDPSHTKPLWQSTAWQNQWAAPLSAPKPGNTLDVRGFDPTKSLPPIEYKAPWLEWFRGAQLHLTQLPERLIVVGTIDIEPLPPLANAETSTKAEGPLPTMNLDLFNLPFQFFQGDKPNPSNSAGQKPDNKPAETKKSF